MKPQIKLFTPVIVTMMILLGPLNSYAQYEDKGQIFIPSPDVWRFMKYGNTPIDLYRGIAQTQIPIYTYKDKDFELPISIDYASSGFIPNVQTGVLGLGWFLNAGGSITREVRGIPDETISVSGYVKGYLYYSESSSSKSIDDILSDIEDDRYNWPEYRYPRDNNGYYLERSSDVYHFRFGNHSGSFMFGPNNAVYVFSSNHPKGEYKITMVNGSSATGTGSRIKIQTGDGYEYVFGGQTNSHWLDQTRDPWGGGQMPGSINNPNGVPLTDFNLTWMLAYITAPNGREVTFDYYLPHNEGQSPPTPVEIFDICNPWAYTVTETYYTGTNWGSESATYSNDPNHQYKIRIGKKWGIKLKSIKVDDKLSIDFTYGNKEKEYYKLGEGSAYLPLSMTNLGRLTQITIKELLPHGQSNNLRNYSLQYATSATNIVSGSINSSSKGNPVTFLSSITTPEGQYSFTYYGMDKYFPFHGTSSIDHWGYYNGSGNGTDSYNAERLIPVDDDGNETNWREPSQDGYGSMMGMLKQIIYPLKGRTEFTYEGNTYTSKVVNSLDLDGGGPIIVSGSNTAGGVRILKITDYLDNLTTIFSAEKTFSYPQGILLHTPDYFKQTVEESFQNNVQQYHVTTKSSGSINMLASLSMDRHHIEYPLVKEIFSDNSYNEYSFSCFGTIPDIGEDFNYAIVNTWDKSSPWYREPISLHNERGKLTKKTSYNNHGDPLMITEYIYNKNTPKQYAEQLLEHSPWVYKHRTLVSDYPLTEKKVWDHSNNVETFERYAYNTSGQMTKVTTTRTGIDDIYTSYMSYLSVGDRIYEFPTTTERSYKSGNNGTEKVIDAQKINYNTSIFKPTSIQKASLSPNLTRNNLSSYYYTDVTYGYDSSSGNLSEQTDRNGIKTSYVWGYDKLYPVAVVENASSSQVASKVSSSPSAALSDSQDNALRTIPGASVTTYKYKPFVGVSEIKDNSGRATKYTYDPYGRLSAIRDDQGTSGNLLQEFAYTFGQTSTVQNNIRTTTYTAATPTTGGASNFKDIEFYDGLGYPSQRINVGASPKNNQSIVTPIYYDNMRRESRQYLPYAVSNTGTYIAPATALSNQQTFYDITYNNGTFNTADAQKAYTENIYDDSPLNRVTATSNIGSVFHGSSGKKSTFTYGTNKSGDNVKRFRVTRTVSSGVITQSMSSPTSYPVNTLHKNTTTNEDGTTISTFTDMLGQVVLERVATDGTVNNLDIYYVYDDYGNLCYVLPPELSAGTSFGNDDIAKYGYTYIYDDRNRCVEKRLPGAEPIYMVYDRGDRLVLIQDGNQREQRQWIYNKYDNLNRITSQILLRNPPGGSPPAITYVRNHFDTPNVSLPSTFWTIATLTENRYGGE